MRDTFASSVRSVRCSISVISSLILSPILMTSPILYRTSSVPSAERSGLRVPNPNPLQTFHFGMAVLLNYGDLGYRLRCILTGKGVVAGETKRPQRDSGLNPGNDGSHRLVLVQRLAEDFTLSGSG